MKNNYVKDYAKNDQLSDEAFVVISSQKNIARNGSEYYRLEVGDKTGSMSANIWGDNIANCDLEVLEAGNIVKIWGKIEEYQGNKQLNILSLGKAKEYDDMDFMQVSDKDPEEMWKEFTNHIKSIEDKDIQSLLIEIFKNEEIKTRYKSHPAAQRVHHSFQFGLLEHVLEMLDLSEVVFKYYTNVDKSLVKAGIILHDIGKLYELENQKINVDRTIEGHLIGHIIQGYEILLKYAGEDFPKDKLVKLKHIVLSHHGILEYGSPVVPKTIEAVVVSEVDDTSSKIRQYQRILKENEGVEGDFSKRDFILGTEVYLK